MGTPTPPKAVTAAELLDACNRAILALVQGAQSATVGRRSYSRADLRALREMRVELQRESAVELGTGHSVAAADFGDAGAGYDGRSF